MDKIVRRGTVQAKGEKKAMLVRELTTTITTTTQCRCREYAERVTKTGNPILCCRKGVGG